MPCKRIQGGIKILEGAYISSLKKKASITEFRILLLPYLVFDFVQVFGAHALVSAVSPHVDTNSFVKLLGESFRQSVRQRLGHDAAVVVQFFLVFFAGWAELKR